MWALQLFNVERLQAAKTKLFNFTRFQFENVNFKGV